MKRNKLISILAAITIATSSVGTITAINNSTTVQAAHYSKGYKKWAKKSMYSGRYYKVKLTKKITIRHLKWTNSPVPKLGTKRVLKRGKILKVRAYDQANMAWSLKYGDGNWVYPHHTANWFKAVK